MTKNNSIQKRNVSKQVQHCRIFLVVITYVTKIDRCTIWTKLCLQPQRESENSNGKNQQVAANQGTVSRYIVLGFKFQFPSNVYSCNITDFRFSFYGKVRVHDLRSWSWIFIFLVEIWNQISVLFMGLFLDFFILAHYFGGRNVFFSCDM